MPEQQPHVLALLDKISSLLAEATTLNDLKELRNKAEAARVFIKAAKLVFAAQNRAQRSGYGLSVKRVNTWLLFRCVEGTADQRGTMPL